MNHLVNSVCEFAHEHTVKMLTATRQCMIDGSCCSHFDDSHVYEGCPVRKRKLAENFLLKRDEKSV